MKIFYDLHIHSALSPCADDNMTPANIVGMAAIKGLKAIAVSDHNSIKNVKAVMECGKDFGITVIPAMEVQTSEEIHLLTLFYNFDSIEKFYKTLSMKKIKNRENIFGKQLIIDTNDKVTGKEDNLLHVGIEENIYNIVKRVKEYNGIAIPAHIDRDQNGILAILGDIPDDLNICAVEINSSNETIKNKYNKYRQICNSDAHTLVDIGRGKNYIKAKDITIKSILDKIKGEE